MLDVESLRILLSVEGLEPSGSEFCGILHPNRGLLRANLYCPKHSQSSESRQMSGEVRWHVVLILFTVELESWFPRWHTWALFLHTSGSKQAFLCEVRGSRINPWNWVTRWCGANRKIGHKLFSWAWVRVNLRLIHDVPGCKNMALPSGLGCSDPNAYVSLLSSLCICHEEHSWRELEASQPTDLCHLGMIDRSVSGFMVISRGKSGGR